MKIKIMSFITALLLAVLLLLTSCGDDGNPVDGTSPNIQTITTSTGFVGQAIIIKGTNFGNIQGNSYVSLNGKLDDSSHYTWSSNRIVFIIPSGAVSGDVTVNVDGKTSNAKPITIMEQPSAEAPFLDYLSQDIAQPRQSITIYGKNFGNIRGAVEFKGIKAEDSQVTFWGASKVTVIVPDEALTGKIVVYTQDSIGTNTAEFRVQNTNPIVIMIKIDPGTFIMGTNDEDPWYGPAHEVQITNSFYIGKFEVTQKQYKKVMNGSNPSRIENDSMPVDRVDWLSAVRFCNELSKMENYEQCYTINGDVVTCNFDATGYRIPTEAEWEYACRAGTTTKWAGSINDLGWTNINADNVPHISGTKEPNSWGIYDMHGNVWEWCWDWYSVDFYDTKPYPHIDPKGPTTTDVNQKIIRGGSYLDGPNLSTSAARDGASMTSGNFNLGFRVVRKANI